MEKIRLEEIIKDKDALSVLRVLSSEFSGQVVFTTSRITSYNVCYTKLLRSWPVHTQI